MAHEVGSVPIVMIRVTPASRARATAAAGSSSASRCACVSITQRRWARRHAGRAALRARSRPPGPCGLLRRSPTRGRRIGRAPRRISGAVRGRYAESATAATRRPVGEVVQHAIELGRARLVLRQLPGLRLLHVFVERANELPDHLDRAGDVEDVEPSRHVALDRLDRGGHLALLRWRPGSVPLGSGRSSPSCARRDCRDRSQARARNARGGCRA